MEFCTISAQGRKLQYDISFNSSNVHGTRRNGYGYLKVMLVSLMCGTLGLVWK